MPAGVEPEESAAVLPAEGKAARRWAWIDRTIYFSLCVIALSLPFSTKLAVNVFRVAALLWLVKAVVYRPTLRPRPLYLALLLFLLLTAISSFLSAEPQLSWGRMRTISLLLLVPLVAQSLTSLRQMRLLTMALLFSTLVAVAATGWQYTFGIGVSLEQIKPGSPVERVGLLRNDVITHVDGKRLYAPAALLSTLQHAPSDRLLKISMRRSAPPEFYELQFSRADLLASGLDAPGALGRGHPVRAQGFFKHYVPFSELLMLMAALSFGLALRVGNKRMRWLCALVFLAISVALVATVTRATLAALVVACIAVYWIGARWKHRLASLTIIVAMFVLGSIWFQYTRGPGWFHKNDPSAQYRELMWRDGVHLARQHPWFGVGMDSIYRHWEEWNIQAYRQFPHLQSHFHSSYIQMAAENGLPALLAWLAILWLLGAHLLRHARSYKNKNGIAPGVVSGALAALIAFSLVSVLHYINGDSEFMIAFWLLAGMALAAAHQESSSFWGAEKAEVGS